MVKKPVTKEELNAFLSKEAELQNLLEAMNSLDSMTTLSSKAQGTFLESGEKVSQAAVALADAVKAMKDRNARVNDLLSALNGSSFSELKDSFENLGPTLKKQQKLTDSMLTERLLQIQEEATRQQKQSRRLFIVVIGLSSITLLLGIVGLYV